MTMLGTLTLALETDSSRMISGLNSGAASVAGFQNKVGTASKAVTGALGTAVPVSAAAAGFAVGKFALDSFKAAKSFETAFTRIGAISNATAEDIERWKGQVLDLAGETARAPAELADALFFLSSAGLDASQVMDTLNLAGKAAAVGLGSTVDIAKITANALNAYAGAGLTAAQVTDTLVAAVREGSAEPAEFAAALGRILPIASQAGIEFDEVTASLAALSNIGLDVNEGVTAMRGVMTALAAPTKQTQDAMKALGLSTEDVRSSLADNGLIATLRMLEERTGGNIDMMKALVPNVRALTGVFGLTTQEAAKVDSIIKAVTHSTGSLAEAFAETAASDAFKLEQALNKISIAGQQVATKALPLIASGATIAAESLDDMVVALGALVALRAAPALLLGLASGLEAMAGHTTRAAAGTLSVASQLSKLAMIAGPLAIGIGLVSFGLSVMREDARRNAQIMAGWTAALLDGTMAIDTLGVKVERLKARTEDFGIAGEALRDNLDRMGATAILTAVALGPVEEAFGAIGEGLQDFEGPLERLAVQIEETAQAAANFAGMTDKEFKDFRSGAIESINGVVGSLSSFDRKWELSARAAARAMSGMVAKSREMRNAYDELDAMELLPRFNKYLIEQGPAAVVAFTNMNRREQERFIADWRKVDRNTLAAIGDLPSKLKSQGRDSASAFALGMISGFDSMSGRVAAEAAAMAQDAVDAANGVLQSQSPSRVMYRVGQNFVAGFVGGIHDGAGDAEAAISGIFGSRFVEKVRGELDGLVEAIRSAAAGLEGAELRQAEAFRATWLDQAKAFRIQAKELEALVSTAERKLERIQERAQRFADEIRSGFDIDLIGGLGNLEELSAETASAFLSQQLADAQAFAAALQQLADAGLSGAGLAELAGQGPGALSLAQLLLGNPALIEQFNATQQIIGDLATQATDHLVNEVFGKAIEAASRELERAERQVERFASSLERFIEGLRADAVRSEVSGVIESLRHLQRALDRVSGGTGAETADRAAAFSGGGGVGGVGGLVWPSGGGGGTVINITVQGSVWETERLADAIDERLGHKRWRGGRLALDP